MNAPHAPTQVVAEDLTQAYDFFNERLFGGRLEPCLITLQRQPNSFGYYARNRFLHRDGASICEIAVNPSYFASRPVESTLSTLVHEMCHLKMDRIDKAEHKNGYHCAEWAKSMQAVGLMPTATGELGGAKTGYRVTHYIIADGPFSRHAKELLARGWQLKYVDRDAIAVSTFTSKSTGVIVEVPEGEEDPPVGLAAAEHPTKPPAKKRQSKDPPPAAAELGAALGVALGITPRQRSASSQTRTKYQCKCNNPNAVWGKAALLIRCMACDQMFTAVSARTMTSSPASNPDDED
jgi:predicted SprT family Zn-dependent metalloprotease